MDEECYSRVTIKFPSTRTRGTNQGRLLCVDCPVSKSRRTLCRCQTLVLGLPNDGDDYRGDIIPVPSQTEFLTAADLQNIRDGNCKPEITQTSRFAESL